MHLTLIIVSHLPVQYSCLGKCPFRVLVTLYFTFLCVPLHATPVRDLGSVDVVCVLLIFIPNAYLSAWKGQLSKCLFSDQANKY